MPNLYYSIRGLLVFYVMVHSRTIALGTKLSTRAGHGWELLDPFHPTCTGGQTIPKKMARAWQRELRYGMPSTAPTTLSNVQ